MAQMVCGLLEAGYTVHLSNPASGAAMGLVTTEKAARVSTA
jgi:hypothetical protein